MPPRFCSSAKATAARGQLNIKGNNYCQQSQSLMRILAKSSPASAGSSKFAPADKTRVLILKKEPYFYFSTLVARSSKQATTLLPYLS